MFGSIPPSEFSKGKSRARSSKEPRGTRATRAHSAGRGHSPLGGRLVKEDEFHHAERLAQSSKMQMDFVLPDSVAEQKLKKRNLRVEIDNRSQTRRAADPKQQFMYHFKFKGGESKDSSPQQQQGNLRRNLKGQSRPRRRSIDASELRLYTHRTSQSEGLGGSWPELWNSLSPEERTRQLQLHHEQQQQQQQFYRNLQQQQQIHNNLLVARSQGDLLAAQLNLQRHSLETQTPPTTSLATTTTNTSLGSQLAGTMNDRVVKSQGDLLAAQYPRLAAAQATIQRQTMGAAGPSLARSTSTLDGGIVNAMAAIAAAGASQAPAMSPMSNEQVYESLLRSVSQGSDTTGQSIFDPGSFLLYRTQQDSTSSADGDSTSVASASVSDNYSGLARSNRGSVASLEAQFENNSLHQSQSFAMGRAQEMATIDEEPEAERVTPVRDIEAPQAFDPKFAPSAFTNLGAMSAPMPTLLAPVDLTENAFVLPSAPTDNNNTIILYSDNQGHTSTKVPSPRGGLASAESPPNV